MATRSSSLIDGTSTGIERKIGSQYDNVKVVADNINKVVVSADNIGAINAASDNIGVIELVGSSIDSINQVMQIHHHQLDLL